MQQQQRVTWQQAQDQYHRAVVQVGAVVQTSAVVLTAPPVSFASLLAVREQLRQASGEGIQALDMMLAMVKEQEGKGR
jgi:hypothetical protein